MLLTLPRYVLLDYGQHFMYNYTMNLVNFEGPRNIPLENVKNSNTVFVPAIMLIMIWFEGFNLIIHSRIHQSGLEDIV